MAIKSSQGPVDPNANFERSFTQPPSCRMDLSHPVAPVLSVMLEELGLEARHGQGLGSDAFLVAILESSEVVFKMSLDRCLSMNILLVLLTKRRERRERRERLCGSIAVQISRSRNCVATWSPAADIGSSRGTEGLGFSSMLRDLRLNDVTTGGLLYPCTFPTSQVSPVC